MLTFTIRRLVLAVPTLAFIALVIFVLLEMSPGDPMAQVPLTVPPEVKEQMRRALGLDQPAIIRFFYWLYGMFITEPLVAFDAIFGTSISAGMDRVISFQTRGPVMNLIMLALPQTLWVVGLSYVVGVIIALPIGIYSAYRQYSAFDQAGTFISMIGFSVPPFVTGLLAIILIAVPFGLPTKYDTTLVVNDFESFMAQIRQMILPVMVLAVQTTAQISRFMRSSMLDNLRQDYVRTARAKGLGEREVVMQHVVRNSMIPVVTVIALGVPGIFGGAIITENLFGVNGLGSQLIGAIQANDTPTVLTLTFMFAVLVVLFNLIADVLYGILDPRIRYD